MAINPYVPASATGNGSQVDFTFTFPYIFPTHVKAYLNGVQTTAFTFFSTNVLRFTVAPALGVNVLIVRETPGDDLAAVIQPGGPLPIVGLNNNFLQSLYYNQETQYDAANQSTAGLQAQVTAATNTANVALTQSGSAVTTANAASATANGIAATAAAANATADTANTNATAAVNTANGISATANTALSTANSALSAAATAQARADRAPAMDTTQSPTAGATNITFTGIPSWVKRITLSWSALTMQSGYANLQLGTSSGLKTSGYGTAPSTNYTWLKSIGGGESIYNNYTGLGVYLFVGVYTGSGNVSIVKMSNTTWMISGMCLMPGASYVIGYQAYQVLASDLTQLALVGDGSATFSAGGNINILYE